jgi:hypothetical protein
MLYYWNIILEEVTMKSTRSKVSVLLATIILLLTLVLGPASGGMAARDGMEGLMAPVVGGGSGT